MQRIEVTGEGITLTRVIEPRRSALGKETRPGVTSVDALPWDEISVVTLSALDLSPDGDRWVHLTVDHISGEYFEVPEAAEGFADAVRELCRVSGRPRPDAATLTMAGQVIWPGPEPA